MVYQDPEYNVLGSRGIRGRAKKSKSNEEGGEEVSSAEGQSLYGTLLGLLTLILGC